MHKKKNFLTIFTESIVKSGLSLVAIIILAWTGDQIWTLLSRFDTRSIVGFLLLFVLLAFGYAFIDKFVYTPKVEKDFRKIVVQGQEMKDQQVAAEEQAEKEAAKLEVENDKTAEVMAERVARDAEVIKEDESHSDSVKVN